MEPAWFTISGLALDILGFAGFIVFGPPQELHSYRGGALWVMGGKAPWIDRMVPPKYQRIIRWASALAIFAGFALQIAGTVLGLIDGRSAV